MNVTISGKANTREIKINGRALSPRRSNKLRNHSYDFNWGYGGSGPTQLALAICIELFGELYAMRWYHDFKWKFVAKWPQGEDFEIELELSEFMKIREIHICSYQPKPKGIWLQKAK